MRTARPSLIKIAVLWLSENFQWLFWRYHNWCQVNIFVHSGDTLAVRECEIAARAAVDKLYTLRMARQRLQVQRMAMRGN